MIESDDYKRGWYDGYQAAQKQNPTITQPPSLFPRPKGTHACHVCGIDFGDKAWGYVCYVDKCPTKVTSITTS